jgi:hypothetical protein
MALSDRPSNHEHTKKMEEEERPQKRIKITASNGWRVLQEMKNNCVDKINTVSKSTPRCFTKGKLARLVAMPLDLLFEVCPRLYLADARFFTHFDASRHTTSNIDLRTSSNAYLERVSSRFTPQNRYIHLEICCGERPGSAGLPA